jgi:hypothetical protein
VGMGNYYRQPKYFVGFFRKICNGCSDCDCSRVSEVA